MLWPLATPEFRQDKATGMQPAVNEDALKSFTNVSRSRSRVDLAARTYIDCTHRYAARNEVARAPVTHAHSPTKSRKVIASGAKRRVTGSSALESLQAPPPFRRVRTGANLTDHERPTPRVHEEQWTRGFDISLRDN